MAIKIVTDSAADLPTALAKELDVTVVPVYLRFGREVYRDRVDISEDERITRLKEENLQRINELKIILAEQEAARDAAYAEEKYRLAEAWEEKAAGTRAEIRERETKDCQPITPGPENGIYRDIGGWDRP